MSDIKEKISALYDGELDHNEIDDLLKIIDKDPSLQEELSLYSLAGLAIHHDKNNIASINSSNLENKSIFSNLWFTNGLTAAASILLTLFIINNVGGPMFGSLRNSKCNRVRIVIISSNRNLYRIIFF